MSVLKIRPEVMWFARQMERRLRLNDYKGGWKNMAYSELQVRVFYEAIDLNNEEDPRLGTMGAVDVANLCMMLADNQMKGRDMPFLPKSAMGENGR